MGPHAGIGCNEALSQIDIKGVGRDIFWPPEVETRDYTVESTCYRGLVAYVHVQSVIETPCTTEMYLHFECAHHQ